MDWVSDILQLAGIALLVAGGWSVADSLARIAKAAEAKSPPAA